MKPLRHTACLPIYLYRWFLSPLKQLLFGHQAGCRYQPTCSAYAIHSILSHGIIQGSLLSLKRLSRCHPWGASGWDPVPTVDGAHNHPSHKPLLGSEKS
ncbi:MAG: membrane protein insertion efficiency factor YidD [Limisphaerales bacterium]|jgi:putative membrane protein insertion efficiency factor|nr:membrane protein insertion efficiency factor YidD [Verrucomicrobiota bacterium]